MKRDIRLLIVDDNVATRYALRRRLERHGYVVLEAGTGGDGLALIDSEFIDALIAATREMVRVLKRTRSLASLSNLVDQLPHSLKTAALSTKLRLKDHQRLLTTLSTPTHQAMEWAT